MSLSRQERDISKTCPKMCGKEKGCVFSGVIIPVLADVLRFRLSGVSFEDCKL